MDNEALITLNLERHADCVLVSSPEFPLLHLSISDSSERVIEASVFPVLKKMVEHKVGDEVDLRFVKSIDSFASQDNIPPHIIARRASMHLG